MRLDEFTKLKELKKDSKVISTIKGLVKDTTASHPDLLDVMYDRGWELVGRGAMAGVFAHPNYAYALKIFSKRDNCYLFFVKEAMKINNPHLPNFKGNPVEIGHHIAVRLEKLIPVTVEEYQANYGLTSYLTVNDIYTSWATRLSLSHLKTDQPDADITEVATKFEKNNPQFVEALKMVVTLSKRVSCAMDLHYGNFMKRGDTWVIIDPVIG